MIIFTCKYHTSGSSLLGRSGLILRLSRNCLNSLFGFTGRTSFLLLLGNTVASFPFLLTFFSDLIFTNKLIRYMPFLEVSIFALSCRYRIHRRRRKRRTPGSIHCRGCLGNICRLRRRGFTILIRHFLSGLSIFTCRLNKTVILK